MKCHNNNRKGKQPCIECLADPAKVIGVAEVHNAGQQFKVKRSKQERVEVVVMRFFDQQENAQRLQQRHGRAGGAD